LGRDWENLTAYSGAVTKPLKDMMLWETLDDSTGSYIKCWVKNRRMRRPK
jgi:hypothetical protein